MDDAGDHGFDAGLVTAPGHTAALAFPIPQLLQPLHHGGQLAGLQHQIPDPHGGSGGGYILRNKGGCSQGDGLALHPGDRLQYTESVLLCQHQIQDQDLGLLFGDLADSLLPIGCRANYLKASGALQSHGQAAAKIFRAVGNKNACCVFHNVLSCHDKFLPVTRHFSRCATNKA